MNALYEDWAERVDDAHSRLRQYPPTHMAEVKQTLDDLLAEVDRLTAERDQAIAHDRQPYPTADAYEKVCAALEKHRQRADAAEAERDAAFSRVNDAALSIAALRETVALREAAPSEQLAETQRLDTLLDDLADENEQLTLKAERLERKLKRAKARLRSEAPVMAGGWHRAVLGEEIAAAIDEAAEASRGLVNRDGLVQAAAIAREYATAPAEVQP